MTISGKKNKTTRIVSAVLEVGNNRYNVHGLSGKWDAWAYSDNECVAIGLDSFEAAEQRILEYEAALDWGLSRG